MNRASVFKLHKRFKEGPESVRDDERCGRSKGNAFIICLYWYFFSSCFLIGFLFCKWFSQIYLLKRSIFDIHETVIGITTQSGTGSTSNEVVLGRHLHFALLSVKSTLTLSLRHFVRVFLLTRHALMVRYFRVVRMFFLFSRFTEFFSQISVRVIFLGNCVICFIFYQTIRIME